MWWIFVLISVVLLIGGGVFILLYFITASLERFERRLILLFSARTDSICSLYEATKNEIARPEDIYAEIFELRKKEFSLIGITKSLETFLPLQSSIHHEINFIFQICNKNITLQKNKRFLYIREIIISHSGEIGKQLEKYKKLVKSYNKVIRIKNYSIIGYIIPFSYKKVL